MNLIICWGAYIAIVIRIITAVLLLWQILPLGIKESTVKNGLRFYRIALLTIQICLLGADLIALWLLLDTFERSKGIASTPALQIISALFLLVVTIALYFMYHKQFTPESREIHRQIDIEEKKTEARIANGGGGK